MDKFYVYEYYVEDTGEVFYVGKGSGNRFKVGKRNRFCEDMKATHSWNYKIVAENLPEEIAFQLERRLIALYKANTSYRLTNQTLGGDGPSGWVPSEDFRNKQSAFHKKQWENEAFRQKMMVIRNDENGAYKSDEFRRKISELVCGEKNPNFNNKWSDEQRQHLSVLRKERGLAKDTRNGNSKRIKCVETGEEFDLIKHALSKHNIRDHSNISAALNNPNRTAGGMHWITLE